MNEEERTGRPEVQELPPEAEAPDTVSSSQVDLNTATADELRQLPGIGNVLAARIVEHRDGVGPFANPAEITAVPGVAEATYSRLADRLAAGVMKAPSASEMDADLPDAEPEAEAESAADRLVPAPEPAQTEEQPEGEFVAPVAEPAEAPEPESELEQAAEAPPQGPEPPLVEEVRVRVGCGRLILVGVLSALLGAALALAFVFAVNGTLDFQSAAVRAAQDEVLRVESVVGAINLKVAEVEERLGDIAELDARLAETRDALRRLTGALEELQGTVESLGATQGALRQEFTNLREDLDGLAGHASVLDRRLSETEIQILSLGEEVEILGQSVQRFDAFLLGLQALLNEPLGDLAPTPTPWVAPMDSPEPTPTPWSTSVPRPQVTVIPLATPMRTRAP